MNIISIILLFLVLISIGLGLLVYFRNTRNQVNLTFAVLCILVALSSFINFQISIADSAEEIYALLRITSIRLFIFPTAIYFYILITDQKKLLKGPWVYLLLYLFPSIIVFSTSPHSLFKVINMENGTGWFFYLEKTTLGTAIALYIIFLLVLLLIMGIKHIIAARDYLHRKQAWFVLIGFAVALIMPVVFDIVLPTFSLEIPQTSSATFIIGYSLIAYAIIKYELFSATPESAADEILKNISDAVILTDRFGNITFANQTALKLTGYSNEQFFRLKMNEIFTSRMLDEINTPQSGIINNNIIKFSGIKVPVIVAHTILFQRHKHVNGHAFIVHEITELKNLIDQIAESETRYKNIFENIQSIYFEASLEGTILEVSPSIENFTSYKRDEVIGQPTSIIYANEEQRKEFIKLIKENHKVSHFEILLKDKDGRTDYCMMDAQLILKDNAPVKLVGTITNIDLLKKTEQKIIESEKKYRLVTENSIDFVTQQTEDGHLIYISPAIITMGFQPKDLLGKTLLDFTHIEDKPALDLAMRQSMKTGESFLIEHRMQNIKKQYTWMETRGKSVIDEGQHFLICSTRNIATRKQIEFKLKKSEEQFRILFEKSPDGILLMKDLNTLISANDAVLKIFGFESVEEFLKVPLVFHALPEYQIKMIERERMRKAGISITNRTEIKILRTDGQIRHIEYLIHEMSIQNEHYLQLIMRDITEKVEAEKRIIDSEQKYSLLVETSPDDIFLLNDNFEFLMMNDHAANSLNIEINEVIGKNMFDVFPPYIAEKQANVVREVFSSGEMSEHLKTVTRTALGDRWYSTILIPVKDELNNVVSVMGIGRDITEIEKVELKIRENEEKYRLFLENFQGIAFRMSLENQLEFLYGDVTTITGYTIDEYFKGIPKMGLMIHPEDRMQILKAIKMLKNIPNSKITSECKIFHRNGQIKYLRLFLQNMMDDQGNPAFIQAALFDKTDHYELQNKIINSIMETEDRERKRFAEDLHDELGPLLSSIRIYVNLIQTKTPEQEKERVELIDIAKQLLDDAVLQTKNISYNIMPEILGEYGLIPSIKAFCTKINKANKVRIEIQTDNFGEEERFDNKIELALYRVIKELLNNTLKHSDASEILIRFFKTDNNYNIEFTDDGNGFNLEEKLNSGKTLGLRNVFHRIQSINGSVHFISSPGKGIKVTIKWDY
jgi:PAS domain S-box-containing protein